jgi:hypothetical protein
MIKKFLALGVFAVFCAACVSTSAVRLGVTVARPTVAWQNVAVYRTAEDVPGKYAEVAILASTGGALMTSEGQMWKSMQQKAGKLGANALILDAMSEPKAAAKIAAAFLGVGGAERKGKAVAIYVFPIEDK